MPGRGVPAPLTPPWRRHCLEVDAELLWCQISLKNQRNLTIGAFCRPPNTGAEVLEQLNLSLSRFINSTSSTVVLTGDFNLLDIDWSISVVKGQSRNSRLQSKLLEIIDDHSLTQLNENETRENSILDLSINNPNLISRIETIPGISDHHAIFTIRMVNKKQPRKVLLFRKTDTEGFRAHLN